MAPLKVRKPTAIMFDIVATATKSFFIDQVLFPYIKKNSKAYLAANWENSVIQHDVMLLREAAKKDKSSVKIADASADADTIQRSVCEYVSKALDELKDNEALTQFRFHILFDGYANGHIETPVYTDVAIQIHNWAVDEKIKLYVFSNGWKEATKRYQVFFCKSPTFVSTPHQRALRPMGKPSGAQGPLVRCANERWRLTKEYLIPAEDQPRRHELAHRRPL